MSGAVGFLFEDLIEHTLTLLKSNLKGWTVSLLGEQGIRDFYKEQSLNGVDHLLRVEDPSGNQHLFLIQEKWKLITNQREVSQFLDCCARILARMPDYKGKIHRMWVSRTAPTLNGEKSLQEGQVVVVQSCTSQTILAYMTSIIVGELLGKREAAEGILGKLTNWLPSLEPIVEVVKEAQPTTYVPPVSNFGEKRVLPITKKTLVNVKRII